MPSVFGAHEQGIGAAHGLLEFAALHGEASRHAAPYIQTFLDDCSDDELEAKELFTVALKFLDAVKNDNI